MNCPNCGSQLNCGCQKRIASDGKDVCQNCISSYEIAIANVKTFNYTDPDTTFIPTT